MSSHGGLVAVEPRRQHGALPGRGRQLDAVERATARAQPVDAGQLVRLGRRAARRTGSAWKSAARDRLDFGAQPVERVAMDARQQPAVAPFERRRRVRVKRPRRTTPSASSARSAASASASGDRTSTPPTCRRRRRPDDRQPAAQQFDERVVARPGASRSARRRARGVATARAWMHGGSSGSRSAATQMTAGRQLDARRAPRASSSSRTDPAAALRPPRADRKPAVSSASCSSSASRGSGRASSRTRAIAAGVERARGRRPDAGSLAAACVHRLRAPLLERRIVEERVRPRVQDLVRRTATARACRARRSASSPRVNARRARAIEAVEVHRLFEAVAHRLVDQRMIGHLRDRRECSRGTRPRRETPPPAGRRPACAGAAAAPCGRRGCAAPRARCVAFQRQRVWNIGASSSACTSTSRDRRRVQVAEHVGERERVLRRRATAGARPRSPPPAARS